MARAGSEATATRIPSLDGLRALSISGVLVAHSFFAYHQTHDTWALHILTNLGPLGVSVFFTISGFLITSLLAADRERTGRIDLGAFYMRRAFRILPAYWAFLAFVALAGPTLDASALPRSLLFLTDYLPVGWWLGHTWSLSVEEQFYLLWPLSLALAGPLAPRVAFALIAAAPLSRIVHHLLAPTSSLDAMLHTRIDALMVGCFLALTWRRLGTTRAFRILGSGPVAALSGVFLTIASPSAARVLHGAYVYPVGTSLEAIAAGSILLWAIRSPETLVGRVLNWGPVVHLGVISYSLYLWQQPFFSPEAHATWIGWSPWNVIGALAAAELSYRLVEKPFLRLRDRVVPAVLALRARRAAALAALSPPDGDAL